jgi:arsenate reductase (glutaredoxin)
MSEFTLYHNPRCSKSRQALALLQAAGVQPQLIEYLQATPTAPQLREVVRKLGIGAGELVRKNEEVYEAQYAGKALSEDQWIAAMIKDPILIERPILIRGERAVIGRPPERVRALLDERRTPVAK